jgi:hypothetical protein
MAVTDHPFDSERGYISNMGTPGYAVRTVYTGREELHD